MMFQKKMLSMSLEFTKYFLKRLRIVGKFAVVVIESPQSSIIRNLISLRLFVSSKPTPQQDETFPKKLFGPLMIRTNNESRKLFNFHVANRKFRFLNLWHTKGVCVLTCPFLLWQKNDLLLSLGHFFQGKRKPLFWNGRWETSCGKFDKKPFLIRFRNRKYPFLFPSEWEGTKKRERRRRVGKTKSAEYFPKTPIYFAESCCEFIARRKLSWFKSSLKICKVASSCCRWIFVWMFCFVFT